MVGVQIFKPAKYGTWNETLQAKRATVNGMSLVLHDVVDTRFNNDGYMSSQQHVDEIYDRPADGRDGLAVRQ